MGEDVYWEDIVWDLVMVWCGVLDCELCWRFQVRLGSMAFGRNCVDGYPVNWLLVMLALVLSLVSERSVIYRFIDQIPC